ncbi:hypothetical protein ABZ532_21785 [Streptomyces sp. NPDC019396]|uniref:hypothetical protein n=1 Tax=Streptomyces sp. NPDC019396 TaxID=3154687 RepID=UPI0033C835EF
MARLLGVEDVAVKPNGRQARHIARAVCKPSLECASLPDELFAPLMAAAEERDEHRVAVMEAAGIMARTPRTSRECKQAATDFQLSWRVAESREERARQLAGSALAVRAALAQDDALRKAKASDREVKHGEKKLGWRLRGWLADAIRDAS